MPAITDNGNGQALVSWAALKGMWTIIGLLVAISLASLAWAAREGARSRQVEINTADIKANTEADAAIAEDLIELQVGQAEIKVMLRELKERR